MLEVRGLVKDYPGVKALRGVDFDVRKGEVHCLLGPNGAGKSTLIKCVSGAVEPSGGEILIHGEPLPPRDPAASLQRGVATIYQELDLVEDLDVAQNVFLGHEPRRGPAARPGADAGVLGGAACSAWDTRRSTRAPPSGRCAPPPSRSSRSPAPSPTTPRS